MEGSSLKVNERHAKILDILIANKSVKTADLSDRLGATRQTIHSDIETLANQGKLSKVRGGATINHSSVEPNISLRKVQHKQEKIAIGRVAASLIEEDDTLFFDISTSITEMIPYIQHFNRLTIITTSIEIAYLLGNSDNIQLFVIGGQIRPYDMAATGDMALSMAKNLYVDKAFFGLGGISEKVGLTEYHLSDAYIKRQMIQNAQQSYALFDDSKVGKIAMHKFAELTDMESIISYNIENKTFLKTIKDQHLNYINAAEFNNQ